MQVVPGAAVAALLLAVVPTVTGQPVFTASPAPVLEVTPLTPTPALQAGAWSTLPVQIANPSGLTLELSFGSQIDAPSGGYDTRVDPPRATLRPGEAVVVLVESFAPEAAGGERALLRMTVDSVQHGRILDSQTLVDVAPAPQGPDAGAPAALAAAGAAVLAAAIVWRSFEPLRVGLLGALLPLYSRLAPSRLLEQEKREAIHRLIAAEPGIHFSALRARTGLPSGVLVHHLRKLETHGLVASRREGARRRYAVRLAALPPTGPAPLTPQQRRVLDLLGERPRTQRELAEALGLSQQGTNRHVKALERRGDLEIRFESGAWRCHPVKRAREAPTGFAGSAETA